MPDTPVPGPLPSIVPKEPLAKCDSVDVFASGLHRGHQYTDADLDTIVANFNKLSTGEVPVLSPTLCIGHEEEGEQPLLENTGIPAVGKVARLWRQGKKLLADFINVPVLIAKLINQRAYAHVSAELYDDFTDDGKSYGLTLRRIALLGSEIPQVKSLREIPLAHFADKQKPTSRITKFSITEFARMDNRVFRGPDGRMYFPGIEKLSERIAKFAARPFQTRTGNTGAILDSGKKLYGKAAKQALASDGGGAASSQKQPSAKPKKMPMFSAPIQSIEEGRDRLEKIKSRRATIYENMKGASAQDYKTLQAGLYESEDEAKATEQAISKLHVAKLKGEKQTPPIKGVTPPAKSSKTEAVLDRLRKGGPPKGKAAKGATDNVYDNETWFEKNLPEGTEEYEFARGMTGVPTMGASIGGGALAGGALGAMTGPLAPVMTPLGAIAGGIGGAYLGAKGLETLHNKMYPDGRNEPQPVVKSSKTASLVAKLKRGGPPNGGVVPGSTANAGGNKTLNRGLDVLAKADAALKRGGADAEAIKGVLDTSGKAPVPAGKPKFPEPADFGLDKTQHRIRQQDDITAQVAGVPLGGIGGALAGGALGGALGGPPGAVLGAIGGGSLGAFGGMAHAIWNNYKYSKYKAAVKEHQKASVDEYRKHSETVHRLLRRFAEIRRFNNGGFDVQYKKKDGTTGYKKRGKSGWIYQDDTGGASAGAYGRIGVASPTNKTGATPAQAAALRSAKWGVVKAAAPVAALRGGQVVSAGAGAAAGGLAGLKYGGMAGASLGGLIGGPIGAPIGGAIGAGLGGLAGVAAGGVMAGNLTEWLGSKTGAAERLEQARLNLAMQSPRPSPLVGVKAMQYPPKGGWTDLLPKNQPKPQATIEDVTGQMNTALAKNWSRHNTIEKSGGVLGALSGAAGGGALGFALGNIPGAAIGGALGGVLGLGGGSVVGNRIARSTGVTAKAQAGHEKITAEHLKRIRGIAKRNPQQQLITLNTERAGKVRKILNTVMPFSERAAIRRRVARVRKFSFAGARTKTGNIKAIGYGSDDGQVLYGDDAERALAATARAQAGHNMIPKYQALPSNDDSHVARQEQMRIDSETKAMQPHIADMARFQKHITDASTEHGGKYLATVQAAQEKNIAAAYQKITGSQRRIQDAQLRLRAIQKYKPEDVADLVQKIAAGRDADREKRMNSIGSGKIGAIGKGDASNDVFNRPDFEDDGPEVAAGAARAAAKANPWGDDNLATQTIAKHEAEQAALKAKQDADAKRKAVPIKVVGAVDDLKNAAGGKMTKSDIAGGVGGSAKSKKSKAGMALNAAKVGGKIGLGIAKIGLKGLGLVGRLATNTIAADRVVSLAPAPSHQPQQMTRKLPPQMGGRLIVNINPAAPAPAPVAAPQAAAPAPAAEDPEDNWLDRTMKGWQPDDPGSWIAKKAIKGAALTGGLALNAAHYGGKLAARVGHLGAATLGVFGIPLGGNVDSWAGQRELELRGQEPGFNRGYGNFWATYPLNNWIPKAPVGRIWNWSDKQKAASVQKYREYMARHRLRKFNESRKS